MRKLTVGVGGALVFAAAAMMAAVPQDKTYMGEIMDNACATKDGHTAMMAKEHTTSAKDCSDACVKGGSKYVLYDASAKRIYQLDDQSKAATYSGQKVSVMGKYDSKTKTIAVSNMTAQ